MYFVLNCCIWWTLLVIHLFKNVTAQDVSYNKNKTVISLRLMYVFQNMTETMSQEELDE
jgi:hypothetical protein